MDRPANIRALTNFLRLLAILQLLTTGIAVVPTVWIDAWHHWLGLGPLPDDAVLRYAVRGGAYVQGCIGVLLWVMATDVVRYRPLVLAAGWIYLVSGPAFYFIDVFSGLPRFWCLFDAISCFAVGAILLGLCFLALSNESA